MIAEVVTDFAVDTDWADAAINFDRKKKVWPGGDDTARDRAGGIVKKELRVRGDAEVDDGLCGIVGAGGIAGGRDGLGLIGWMTSEGSQKAGTEAILDPAIVGMMFVEAPLDSEQALPEAADDLFLNGRLRR